MFTLLFSFLLCGVDILLITLLLSYFKYEVFHTFIIPMLLFIEGSCTTPMYSFLQELEVIESQ